MHVHDYPNYTVDEDGQVFRDGRPVKQTPARKRYLTVNLSMNGKSSRRTVHRVVLEAFVGLRPKGMHGCHLDGDNTNNRLSNLAWLTPKENEAQKVLHGTQAVGVRNGASRLTNDQVKRIRELHASGVKYWGCKQIAREFGVSPSTIYRAWKGIHWDHVGGSHEQG
jgi:hypothetical protein